MEAELRGGGVGCCAFFRASFASVTVRDNFGCLSYVPRQAACDIETEVWSAEASELLPTVLTAYSPKGTYNLLDGLSSKLSLSSMTSEYSRS